MHTLHNAAIAVVIMTFQIHAFPLHLDELSAKLAAEQSAKQEAMEKYEKAEHACSMLELDLKNSQDEVAALKAELKTAVGKVRMAHV